MNSHSIQPLHKNKKRKKKTDWYDEYRHTETCNFSKHLINRDKEYMQLTSTSLGEKLA